MIEAHRWRQNGDHPEDNCRVVTPKRDKITNGMSDGDIMRAAHTSSTAIEVLSSSQYDRWCYLNAVGLDTKEFWSEGRIVRHYRNPDLHGSNRCSACGVTMHLHGWIEAEHSASWEARLDGRGTIVCPGNMIITRGSIFDNTARYEVVGYPEFHRRHDQVGSWPTCCYVERGTRAWNREHPQRVLLSFRWRLFKAKMGHKRLLLNLKIADHISPGLKAAIIITETNRYSREHPRAEVPAIPAIELIGDQ